MLDEEDIETPARATWRLPLILLNIASVLGLLASPVMILGSIFLFDAPGSSQNPITNMMLRGNLAMPPVMAVALLCSILGHIWRPRMFVILSASLVVGWLLYMIGLTIALELLCGGSFSCGYKDLPLVFLHDGNVGWN